MVKVRVAVVKTKARIGIEKFRTTKVINSEFCIFAIYVALFLSTN